MRGMELPELSTAVRRALKKNGMSMTSLAEMISLPRTTVDNWFRRGFPLERLGRVLEIAGIPFNDLTELRTRFSVSIARRSQLGPRAIPLGHSGLADFKAIRYQVVNADDVALLQKSVEALGNLLTVELAIQLLRRSREKPHAE